MRWDLNLWSTRHTVQISPPGDFQTFGPLEEALKGRRFSSDVEVVGAVQNWLKTQPKNFFLTKLRNVRNAGTCSLKLRGITLKSNISFVSLYLLFIYLFIHSFIHSFIPLSPSEASVSVSGIH
jgi:hypothetical protein